MKSNKSFILFRNIFLKFTIAFIAVGLIPLLFLSSISLRTFSNSMEKYTISNFQQMMMYTSRSLENIVEDYNSISKLIYSYNSDNNERKDDYSGLGKIIKSPVTADLNSKAIDKKKMDLMDDFIKNILYTNQNIQNVFFIDYKKNLYYSSKATKQFDYTYDFFEHDQFNEVIENTRSLTILPTHPEEYFVKSVDNVITFGRNYLDLTREIKDEKILGTLLMDVDLSVFDDLFSGLTLGDSGEVYLVDNKGYCIYSNEKKAITKKIPWFIEKQNEFENMNYSGFVSDNEAYYIFQKVETGNWIVVSKINKKAILKKIEDIRSYIFVVIILCSAGLILVAIAFSKGFSLPIKRIIRQMKKVESGNLDVSVEVKSQDEVGQLATGFNNMTSELKGHINKSYIAQIKQKEAELNALKTRIRPHFLYNTLEVIRMTAVENEDEKVADMIHSLASQLKYIIGYNDDMVTVGREVKMVKEYFNLIRLRYDNKMSLELKIPENHMNLYFLKLTLQPIIENAVIHGIKPKEGYGKVMITSEINNEKLEISVFDDGVGMSQEKLDKINRLLAGEIMGEHTPEGWKNIGIKNVHDRLRMNFGEKYGLEINSQERIGTVVKILIPIIEEGNMKND